MARFASALMAAAQAPAPQHSAVAPGVALPAPPPVVLRRVSYSAEPMFGFDASGMRPEGQVTFDDFIARGESAPITTPQTCEGKTNRAELIACLQPDRRVEIAVSGTR